MSKRHQSKASGKKTRTGQHRSSRHTTKNMLNQMSRMTIKQIKRNNKKPT